MRIEFHAKCSCAGKSILITNQLAQAAVLAKCVGCQVYANYGDFRTYYGNGVVVK